MSDRHWERASYSPAGLFGMLTVGDAVAQWERQYSCAPRVLAALQTHGLRTLLAWAREQRVTARERAAAWACIRHARR